MKFDELTITDVCHQEKTEGRIHLDFSIGDREYALVLLNENGDDTFSPARVYHRLSQKCSLCKKHGQYSNCEWFTPHLHALFHKMIELPSIRLKWLYIDHV